MSHLSLISAGKVNVSASVSGVGDLGFVSCPSLSYGIRILAVGFLAVSQYTCIADRERDVCKDRIVTTKTKLA